MYMYGINEEVAQLFVKSEEMILPPLFDIKERVESDLVISKESVPSKSSFQFVSTAAEATARSGILGCVHVFFLC